MSKGTTFWRKDDDGENCHLRFVISEPDVDNKVLVVHMTKWKNNGREDNSCILKLGDHDCVTAKSWIRYDKAIEPDYPSLLSEKFKGLICPEKNISPSILSRIQAGARQSPALPLKFQKYFDRF